MDRGTHNFITWCLRATSLIRYGPDRNMVSKELMDHLEDHRSALMEQGMTQEEASEKALEAMGSADEIAPQLAAVHRPFWGYFLRASKIAVVVLLCLCIVPVWRYIKNLDLQETPSLRQFDIYSEESYGGDTGRTLLHLSHPDTSFTAYGSRFTITDAALIIYPKPSGSLFPPSLYIRMQQTSSLPYQQHKEFFPGPFRFAPSYFIARDSLGNEYAMYPSNPPEGAKYMRSYTVQSGVYTATHELWINNFPPEAEWVDLCYERDGQSIAIRIYLSGGSSK